MGSRLSEKGMLVTLSIGQWTGRKEDKQASKEVEQRYQTKGQVGTYHKILIAQDALKTISRAVNEARTFHYENTLPWNDNGARLLPTANYFRYTQAMQAFKEQFEHVVSIFVDNYPALVEEAQTRLNGLFKQEDYPTVSKIKHRYHFDTQFDPIPDSQDFRIDLQGSELERIRAEVEARGRDKESVAMRDAWKRLYDAVSHMSERLANPDNTFRDTLVGNILDICGLLPAFNISDNPELEAKRAEVEAKLARINTTGMDAETMSKAISARAQELRDDNDARAETARAAQDILKSMEGWL